MRYLLDVNALLALGFQEHQFHERVARWVTRQPGSELLSCSITELGFVRVLAQAPQYGITVAQAGTLLQRLKRSKTLKFSFIADDLDAGHLPGWVRTARQTTDGHLASLAVRQEALLATLDEHIPGAFVIPA